MAYLIAGHGEEIPYNNTNQKRTFKVPPGCTIVVHKHPYELSNEKEFNNITDKLLLLPKDVINDPVKHKYEIINKLGSVVFYEEGEQCPYFIYQTLSCFHENKDPFFTHCSGRIGSGVNNLMKMKDTFRRTRRANQSKYKNTDINYDYIDLRADTLTRFTFDEIVELLSSMYRFSEYPTQEKISTFIRNALITWKTNSLPKGVKYNDMGAEDNIKGIELEVIKNILRVLVKQDFINPTQEFLCNTLPGVYYNFVCRFTEETKNINQLINNLNKSQIKHTRLLYSKPKLLRAPSFNMNMITTRLNEDPSITNRLQNINAYKNNTNKRKNRTANLLKTRLLETELKRKKNIKNVYMNPKYVSNRMNNAANVYAMEREAFNELYKKNPELWSNQSNLLNKEYQNKVNILRSIRNFAIPSNSVYNQLQNGTKKWVKREKQGGTRKRK